jgi:hypothetical protein
VLTVADVERHLSRAKRVMLDERFCDFPGADERFDWWLEYARDLVAILQDRERLIDPRAMM